MSEIEVVRGGLKVKALRSKSTREEVLGAQLQVLESTKLTMHMLSTKIQKLRMMQGEKMKEMMQMHESAVSMGWKVSR
jgi:hypothetical protein